MPTSSGSVATPSSERPGGGWQLIDFQASQFGTRDEVSFTINLGISFAELQIGEEHRPSLGQAHIRQRIGWLLDARGDLWWNLDTESDWAAVAAEVTNALVARAIPWFEAIGTLDEVLAATRRHPKFIETWQLARLSVLAERAAHLELADKLRHLARPEAD